MELQELYALMDRFSASPLSELSWRKKDEEIVMRKEAAPSVGVEPVSAVPVDVPQIQEENLIRSPLVGVFHSSSAPGENPFVLPGESVRKGETMCIIEAMKMMSSIPAPCDCVVEAVLAGDGDTVGFHDPLFRIRKD